MGLPAGVVAVVLFRARGAEGCGAADSLPHADWHLRSVERFCPFAGGAQIPVSVQAEDEEKEAGQACWWHWQSGARPCWLVQTQDAGQAAQ